MSVQLPIFSFLSTFLLVLVLPAQVHHYSIPSASIIVWLILCNLIHGINTVLWFGNQAEHAPVWCDISSVVLLGAMVAIPGCFLCISRRLEAISSFRDFERTRGKMYGLASEVVMCFLLPALYMGLHTIVQDRRFVILEDFGCQAAVHDSLLALIIVWLPPLCISIIGIFFCLSAVINVGKSHNSRSHYPPEMTSSRFIRHIIFAMSGMLYVVIVYVYAWSSITSSGLQPWTSISQTRSQISQVEVVPSHSQMGFLSQLIWWFIPIWSLLLFVLSAPGEETQRGYRTTLTWLSERLRRDMLPKQLRCSRKTSTVPVHLLRSGWDRDLDLPSPHGSLRSKRLSFFKKTETTRASTPSPTPPDDEVLFAQSTHKYLASNTAQQLCLPSPPPAVRLQQNVSPIAFLPKQSRAGAPFAMDVDPIISGSPSSPGFPVDMWPQLPPTSHPPASPQGSAASIPDPYRPPSLRSTRSSLGSTIIDALGAIPDHFRDAPFSVNGPGVATAQGPRGPVQHRPSTRKGQKNDVVYMTVVHETVAGS